METERIERKNKTIDPLLFLPEGYHCSQDRVKTNYDEEDTRIGKQNQTGEEKVCLTKIPLFYDIHCQQATQTHWWDIVFYFFAILFFWIVITSLFFRYLFNFVF